MNKSRIVNDGRSKKRPGLEEQKNSIIHAATSLFSKHGSRTVSISKICLLADITRPTFYRCFKDKDALLSELYQNSVYQSVQDILITHFQNSGNDKSWVHAALDDVYDAIFEQAELADLLFREASDPHSPAYGVINSAFETIAATMIEALGINKERNEMTIYFKAVMAANQWIVHDAINKGLSDKNRTEAKQACWLMASKLFELD